MSVVEPYWYLLSDWEADPGLPVTIPPVDLVTGNYLVGIEVSLCYAGDSSPQTLVGFTPSNLPLCPENGFVTINLNWGDTYPELDMNGAMLAARVNNGTTATTYNLTVTNQQTWAPVKDNLTDLQTLMLSVPQLQPYADQIQIAVRDAAAPPGMSAVEDYPADLTWYTLAESSTIPLQSITFDTVSSGVYSAGLNVYVCRLENIVTASNGSGGAWPTVAFMFLFTSGSLGVLGAVVQRKRSRMAAWLLAMVLLGGAMVMFSVEIDPAEAFTFDVNALPLCSGQTNNSPITNIHVDWQTTNGNTPPSNANMPLDVTLSTFLSFPSAEFTDPITDLNGVAAIDTGPLGWYAGKVTKISFDTSALNLTGYPLVLVYTLESGNWNEVGSAPTTSFATTDFTIDYVMNNNQAYFLLRACDQATLAACQGLGTPVPPTATPEPPACRVELWDNSSEPNQTIYVFNENYFNEAWSYRAIHKFTIRNETDEFLSHFNGAVLLDSITDDSIVLTVLSYLEGSVDDGNGDTIKPGVARVRYKRGSQTYEGWIYTGTAIKESESSDAECDPQTVNPAGVPVEPMSNTTGVAVNSVFVELWIADCLNNEERGNIDLIDCQFLTPIHTQQNFEIGEDTALQVLFAEMKNCSSSTTLRFETIIENYFNVQINLDAASAGSKCKRLLNISSGLIQASYALAKTKRIVDSDFNSIAVASAKAFGNAGQNLSGSGNPSRVIIEYDPLTDLPGGQTIGRTVFLYKNGDVPHSAQNIVHELGHVTNARLGGLGNLDSPYNVLESNGLTFENGEFSGYDNGVWKRGPGFPAPAGVWQQNDCSTCPDNPTRIDEEVADTYLVWIYYVSDSSLASSANINTRISFFQDDMVNNRLWIEAIIID